MRRSILLSALGTVVTCLGVWLVVHSAVAPVSRAELEKVVAAMPPPPGGEPSPLALRGFADGFMEDALRGDIHTMSGKLDPAFVALIGGDEHRLGGIVDAMDGQFGKVLEAEYKTTDAGFFVASGTTQKTTAYLHSSAEPARRGFSATHAPRDARTRTGLPNSKTRKKKVAPSTRAADYRCSLPGLAGFVCIASPGAKNGR